MKTLAALSIALRASSCLWPVAVSAFTGNIRIRVRRPHAVKMQDSFLFQRRSCRNRYRTPAATCTRSHDTTTATTAATTTFPSLRRRHSRLPSISVAVLTAFSACTRHAIAQSSLLLSRPRHPVRTALKVVACSYVILASLQQIRVKRRQALDATSEWGRYAAHPGARGRAVVALCLYILPYWLVGFVLQQQQQQEARRTRLLKQSGSLFADGLLQLGPLYIKLGQIVSCREKLLPTEWKEALERLQDRVPSRSGQAALDLAYASVGSKQKFDRLFSNFTTTPLAAASLGQVHRAVLHGTNDAVAVKLQRPYLREIYDQDFELLLNIATIVDRFVGKKAQVGGVAQSWTEIFTNAKTILYREIDYRDEADNAIRFAQDFGLGKNGTATQTQAVTRTNEPLPSAAPWLRTPYVYRNVSSEKILVMEYVPSIKITDTEELKKANVTAEEKEYLADSLARTYLRQFCVNKFFSTDPHPGNLGVERVLDGRPRLVFYDFGQACELNSDQADGILDVIEAIVDSDATRCVHAFEKMGVLTDDVNVDKVRAKVQDNFEKGLVKVRKKKLKKAGYKFNKNSARVSPTKGNSTSTVNNATEVDSEVMKYFKLPAEYAFVARAISQMDGVGKSLDPDFDFISSAAPNIVEIKGATTYLKDEFNKWVNSVQRRVTDCWMNVFNRK